MISKKLIELQEQLEFDYDLAAVELDTCAKRLYCLIESSLTDAISKDAFEIFFKRTQETEAVVVSIDNNTDIYEVGDDSLVIILHSSPKDRYIISDIQDAKRVEHMVLNSK